MRNIVLVQDIEKRIHLPLGNKKDCEIVSYTIDLVCDAICFLTNDGLIYSFPISSSNNSQRLLYSLTKNNSDESKWFYIQFISDINSFICISRSGTIIALKYDEDYSLKSSERSLASEEVGIVDGGISSACWSPDQSNVVIITNNNTIMLMSNNWEDVFEISLPDRIEQSPTNVHWCYDGELFAISSVDSSDEIARIRIYSKTLQLLSTAYSVTSPIIIRGLGSALAVAPNGSMIACSQRKSNSLTQIALFERNGLKHGEIELQLPSSDTSPSSNQSSAISWIVASLHFDLATTVIAVTLSISNNNNNSNNSNNSSNISAPEATASNSESNIGVIQLYYRNNYHWYLKQQWKESHLRCLGFDEEKNDRLYMTYKNNSEDSLQIRIIDFVWDTSHSYDSTVNTVVVDGNKLLLTPLGLAIVPPPMSKHELTLPSTCRATCYWICNHNSNNNNNNDRDSGGQIEGYSTSVVEEAIRGKSTFSTDVTENNSITTTTITNNGLIDNDSWGLICLLDNNNIRIHVAKETATCPYRYIDINTQLNDQLKYYRLRSLTASTHQQQMIIYLAASLFDETTNKDNNYLIIIVLTNQFEIYKIHLVPIAGQICRLFCWSNYNNKNNDNDCYQVSFIQTNIEGDFEVWQLTLEIIAEVDNGSTFRIFYEIEKESSIPEPSYHLLTIPTRHHPIYSQNSICLSTKGRLYCRELLLASGVNSIDINSDMNVLLYVTVGTRPMLKFISLPFLLTLDYHAAAEDHKFGWEIQEGNRPVERGSRLLASVNGEAKVIIQLPRGNLEAFEPRILLLEKAKKLILQKKIFSCLLLLRKQRIDLNFLVDFSPQIFLDTIPTLIEQIIENNNVDYLSLLITSLESYDVLTFKYKPLKHQLLMMGSQEENSQPWNERLDQKLNIICSSLQQVLLPLVKNGQTKLMQPLLYTYVKCQPPQLLAALQLIRDEAMKKCLPSSSQLSSSEPPSSSIYTITRNHQISPLLQTQIQSYLKYLMFLVEGPKLFEVALSDCDFELSKIIARLSQMDPKVYLPLLSEFETNRHSYHCEDTGNLAMRFQVNKYCKKMELACQFGIQALTIGKVEDMNRLEPLTNEIIQVIKDMKFQELLLPMINTAYHSEVKLIANIKNKATTTTRQSTPPVSLLSKLLWDIRQSYGMHCQSQGRYEEAITSFLLVHPPDVMAAIRAAKSSGNLLLAVTLTEKYEGTLLEGTQLSSRGLVTEIIETYRTIIEQSQGCLEDVFGYVEDNNDTTTTTSVNINGSSSTTASTSDGTTAATATATTTITTSNDSNKPTTTEQDRPVEIARLCIDYCDDVEGAVEILSMSQRWKEAITICCRKQRKDLLLEVRSACVSAAKELLSLLLKKSLKIPQIVSQLNLLWKDGPARLKDVASTESKLSKELEYDQHPSLSSASVLDDARSISEFSEFSQSSQRSSSTTASRSTVGSGISAASLSSQSSASSSTSYRSRSSTSTFSIQGIDHSILSRGGGGSGGSQGHIYNNSSGNSSSTSIPITEESQHMNIDGSRKKKKSKSRRHKGDGVDVWGLRKEIELSQELRGLANIEKAGRAVVDFCHALVLLGGLEETLLANYLQCAFDDYIKVLVENPVAEAPLYPIAWLRLKDMLAITAFQSIENVERENHDLVETKHTKFRDNIDLEIIIWNNLRIKSLG